MVYVRRLKERQNVIKMFRVTHPHGFLVLEAPEPKGGCSQVIAEKYTLFCAIIVSKREILDSSSQWAQGGVAAVMSNEDSIESHVKDTEFVGGGLTDPKVASFVASHGKEAIQWLNDLHVPFSRDDTTHQFHLTKEGGHSHRRVVHAKDATGLAIQATLSEQVKAHANITILENHIAVDLITEKKSLKVDHIKSNRCLGAYILNNKTGKVITVSAQETILAAGGVSKVYLYTTNPDVSTGDGVAMAWRVCRSLRLSSTARTSCTTPTTLCRRLPREISLLLRTDAVGSKPLRRV